MQCKSLEGRAVPRLHHHLTRAAGEPAAEPVVDDEEAGGAARAPPLRAAVDNGDGARGHRDREVDDAPVPCDAGRATGELPVDRERIAARVAAVEALEEHGVLEGTGPCGVATLECVLALTGVVRRI